MGFKRQIRRIVQQHPMTSTGRQQTLMFLCHVFEGNPNSCSWPLHSNTFLSVGRVTSSLKISFKRYCVLNETKSDMLVQLLQGKPDSKVLVLVHMGVKQGMDTSANYLSYIFPFLLFRLIGRSRIRKERYSFFVAVKPRW